MQKPLYRYWQLDDGRRILIRPIFPDDARIEADFVRSLSSRSRHFRFMGALKELSPSMLERFTQVDFTRDMALIAVHETDSGKEEIAVARYTRDEDGVGCEFAVVVADAWQGHGIATQLLEDLIAHARDQGLRLMRGVILRNNFGMLEFVKRLGFEVEAGSDTDTVTAVKPLE